MTEVSLGMAFTSEFEKKSAFTLVFLGFLFCVFCVQVFLPLEGGTVTCKVAVV